MALRELRSILPRGHVGRQINAYIFPCHPDNLRVWEHCHRRIARPVIAALAQGPRCYCCVRCGEPVCNVYEPPLFRVARWFTVGDLWVFVNNLYVYLRHGASFYRENYGEPSEHDEQVAVCADCYRCQRTTAGARNAWVPAVMPLEHPEGEFFGVTPCMVYRSRESLPGVVYYAEVDDPSTFQLE